MHRFFLAVCFLSFSFFSAFSQEEENVRQPLKAPPAVLAQIAETKALLKTLPEKEQTLTLFQLLSLEVQLENKQPAKETLQQIRQLVPKAEGKLTQMQMLEALAFAQAEIGDLNAAVESLAQIAEPFQRSENQLNIVEYLLNKAEETKTPPPDVTELLRKALAAAVEANDAGLEAFAAILLSKELGRQGKNDEELAGLLQRAVKKIAELEETEGRNLLVFLIRSGIQAGQTAAVQKIIETTAKPETKQVFVGIAALTLVQNGKTDEGEQLLQTLPAGTARDNTLMSILETTIKTVPAEKITEYLQQASNADAGKTMRQNTVLLLVQNDRFDLARQLAVSTDYADNIGDMILARQLDELVKEKKFDEAGKLVPSFREEQSRFQAQRLLTISKLQENYSEAVIVQSAALMPESDKTAAAELTAEAEKAAKAEPAEERMPALSKVLEAQFQLFDLPGVQKTLALMLNGAAVEKDPAKQIVERLMLAQVQTELGDKSGVLNNLGQLQIVLDGTKEWQTLKGLVPDSVPEDESGATAEKTSPTDAAVQEHVMEVYLRTADLLSRCAHLPQARAAFQKAKQIAYAENEPMKKAEKMLALSRFLAEMETNGN